MNLSRQATRIEDALVKLYAAEDKISDVPEVSPETLSALRQVICLLEEDHMMTVSALAAEEA
jgi:hypothetical protein